MKFCVESKTRVSEVKIITEETLGMILNDIHSLSTVMKEILENMSIKIDHTKVMEKCYQKFSIEAFNEQVRKLVGEYRLNTK